MIERSELSGEAGAPAKRVAALPVEGVLNPNTRAQASLSGEAGAPAKRVAALLMEGVLNPNNREHR
jgi:hypothetical protein